MCFTEALLIPKEFGKIDFTISPPPSFEARKGERLLQSNSPVGAILIREMWEDDYRIWRTDFNCERETHLTVSAPLHSSIGLSYVLKNALHYHVQGLGERVTRRHEYNMTYIPNVECEYYLKRQEYAAFGVQFAPGYLQRWSDSFPLLHQFLERTAAGNAVTMKDINPVLTGDMLVIIRDLQQGTYTGALRKMYLEAKVLELLRLSLDRMSRPAHRTGIHLRESDRTQVRAVHEYITQHSDHPGSLAELARRAGINDHKLNAGFKELYGTTVIAFVIGLRLQKAMTLLLETDLPIKVIAAQAGYSDLPNFTAAFRKKFGSPPSAIRKGAS